jgi:hypothetical protein
MDYEDDPFISDAVLTPLEGRGMNVKAFEEDVDLFAGRATAAAAEYERAIKVQVPFSNLIKPVRAIQDWRYAFDHPGHLRPEVVFATLQQIIGQMEGDADMQERQEKTIAGKVSRFVGFPAEIRAIAGESSPGAGKVGFAAGVVGQIVVGTVASALTAGLIAGVATLWQVAF